MFVFHDASRRTLNAGTLLAACLAITLGIGSSEVATAQNWSGATSSDYGVGSNWVGDAVPTGTNATVTIVAAANNPLLSSGSYNNRQLNINYGGAFTMSAGDLLVSQSPGSNTQFRLGNNAATGNAQFTMTGGNLQVDGFFISTDGRSSNNSIAYYTQSGGKVFINTSGTANGGNSLRMSVAGSNVGYRTYINITGGTTVSSGAITMGQSASSGAAAFVTGTISGGTLMATRFTAVGVPNLADMDDQGTLRFAGGGFKLSGGQMIGSDISARDGFRQGTTHSAQIAPLIASGTVGIEYAGGMTQIYTDRTYESATLSIYNVKTSALQGAPTDPVPSGDYTAEVINRGLKRGIIDAGPNTGAAWTSLANTAIKGNVLSGVSPARLDGIVTNVATIAAFDVADYNTDGVVDQGDYVSWFGANGLTYTGAAPVDIQTVLNNDLPYWGADGNGDGKVDSADYTVWQARVGQRRTDGAFQYAKDQTIDVASGSVSQSDPGFTVGSNVGNMNLTSFNGLNTKSFTKTGAGELVLTGTNNLTYGSTVQGGTLRLSGSQAFVSSWSGTTTVQTGATLQVDAGATAISQTINVAGGTLTVAPGGNLSTTVTSATDSNVSQTFASGVVVSNTGAVTLSDSVPQTVNVASLNVDTTTNGKVDIGRGTVNIASGTAVKIIADITAGRNNGGWNGASGITSSYAAATPFRAVGWLDNGNGSYTVALGAAGDVNLNGVVDADDVLQFVGANKYNTGSLATWAEGDYDYNGVVDADDVLAIVSANLYNTGPYNTVASGLGGGAGVGIGQVNSVPEPATWAILAVGAACAAGRCLRRRSQPKA